MMKKIFIYLTLILASFTAMAQSPILIRGKILDSQEESSLPGATVLLVSKSDSIQKKGTITNEHGEFQIKVRPGQYDFQVSFIGYKSITQPISVNKESSNLGLFKLIENNEFLQEVSITETLPPTQQKGDTTVFNPQAFKVNPDATAGELLAKMPGFYEVDGKLMVEGEEIAEVLIDGKKFFGNNMNQALSIIPNDVIKNIEVYEHKSDEEKFSGFKDQEDKKSLNIVTNKKKKKRLVFGDVASGIGKDSRYGFDGNINSFSDNNNISITGRSKNVNAPLKLSNRRFGNGSIDGNDVQEDGIGINFTRSKNKNDIAFSYEYGNRENENQNSTIRTYTSEALEGQMMNSNSTSGNDRGNHNMNLRVSLNSNPKSQLLLSTRISSTDANSKSNSFSETFQSEQMINENTNMNRSENKNYSIGQNINYSKKLGKKERSLSLQAGFDYSESDSDGKQLSETLNESKEVSQSINRISDAETKDASVRGAISFREAINKNSNVSIGYNINYNSRESDKNGYNFDENTKLYSSLDELTTNRFENSTLKNSGRFSYNMRNKKHHLILGSDFELTSLKNEESFPNKNDFDKDYFAFKPYLKYSFKLAKQKRIMLNYSSKTTTPSVQDLQEVIDLSNPLYISTGNSELEQARSHSLMAFYTASNIKKGNRLSVNVMASTSNNMVGRRTIVAANDTTINNKYFLPTGGQFSQPVNLDGQFMLNANVSYSLPLKKLKSKLNLNTRTNFSHNPTFVNDKKSFTDSWNLNAGMMLSSNINEKIDFTFSSSSRYSNSKNSSSSSSEYISQTTSLNMYWNFYKDFVFRTNASNNYQNNYSTGKEDSYWHLNLGLSTKVFKSQRGELSLTAYDILSKEDERQHITTDLYTADYFTNQLTDFYMLTFSYKLRNSKSKGTKFKRRKRYRGDMRHFNPMMM